MNMVVNLIFFTSIFSLRSVHQSKTLSIVEVVEVVEAVEAVEVVEVVRGHMREEWRNESIYYTTLCHMGTALDINHCQW
jgi:hypothetical protein